ncbi:MAG: aminotransferase [Gammaproteobacteria bacterium]|nr:aminotransferase [Gammaproteobacteria bacterium]
MDTRQLNDRTTEILKQDEHLIHAFSDLHSLQEDGARTVISQAEGAYVFDEQGNRYLDGMAGLWCVNLGHGRREIIDAIAEQLRTLDYFSTFYNLTHPTAAQLAEKLAELAPGDLNRVYFGNSGSVANDSAVRTIHYYFNRLGLTKKKKILSRIGAYHGSTHLAIAMTTPLYRAGWDSADDLVHFLSNPCPYRRPEGMSEAEFGDFLIDELIRDIEKVGAERIACFIAEPIMGAGGVIVPPDGYHQRAANVCADNDILMISDEVVTSFGRLGTMFASKSVFGIQPDVICTAKGLSSGYQPISATILSDKIYEVVSSKDNKFLHGMTYSGHPACCAAALANIEIMEREDLCGHVSTMGPVFEQSLKGLIDLPIVGDVRGSHFMIGIEFVENKDNRDPFEESVLIGHRVANYAQRKGLIVRPLGHMIVLSPPLILNGSEIDFVADVLRESIKLVIDDLRNEKLF